jgi:signal peptidase I
MMIAQTILKWIWFGIVPALFAALALRYLVPLPGEARHTWAEGLARLAGEHTVLFALMLFLVLALLIRYWRFHLPGGRFLSDLPPRLAIRVPTEHLQLYANAAELQQLATTSRVRKASSAPSEFDARLASLASALEGDDPRAVEQAERAVRDLASDAILAIERRRGTVLVAVAVLAGALALFARTKLVAPYQVLSASMLPTLLPGDVVGASKLAYRAGQMPERGEVIVFQRPEGLEGPDHLVKRVIGLPGDRISVFGGTPVINGWQVPACDAGPYVYAARGNPVVGRLFVEFLDGHAYLTARMPLGNAWDRQYEVEPGEVFVMGDDRDDSEDSRAWNRGMGGGIPAGAIEGRAEWLLAGLYRNGHVDLGELPGPLDGRLRLEGLDTSLLRTRIGDCLRTPPVVTRPPAPNHSSPSDTRNGL